jgi:hypothetical protein
VEEDWRSCWTTKSNLMEEMVVIQVQVDTWCRNKYYKSPLKYAGGGGGGGIDGPRKRSCCRAQGGTGGGSWKVALVLFQAHQVQQILVEVVEVEHYPSGGAGGSGIVIIRYKFQ